MKMVEKEGNGIVFYMRQEGRGIGLMNKLKAYKLQDEGKDTVEANEALVSRGSAGLRNWSTDSAGYRSYKNATDDQQSQKSGRTGRIRIDYCRACSDRDAANSNNERYLKTKRDKLGHLILIDQAGKK